jgi:RHH-type transcriptional regulator, rel operon repressor / antitoxin RelB
MANSNTLTLHLDAKLSKRLDRLAKTTRRDRCVLARQAIREFLSFNEWQIAEIKKALREADAGNFASVKEVEEMFRKWALAARK